MYFKQGVKSKEVVITEDIDSMFLKMLLEFIDAGLIGEFLCDLHFEKRFSIPVERILHTTRKNTANGEATPFAVFIF